MKIAICGACGARYEQHNAFEKFCEVCRAKRQSNGPLNDNTADAYARGVEEGKVETLDMLTRVNLDAARILRQIADQIEQDNRQGTERVLVIRYGEEDYDHGPEYFSTSSDMRNWLWQVSRFQQCILNDAFLPEED